MEESIAQLLIFVKKITLERALLALSILISLWFCGDALGKLYRYGRFSQQVLVQEISWSFEEVDPSTCYLTASYQYDWRGSPFSGQAQLETPQLNRFAAEREVERVKNFSWMVWVDPKHPSQSTLERKFPMKSCLYAGMTLAIVAYFYFTVCSRRKEKRAL